MLIDYASCFVLAKYSLYSVSMTGHEKKPCGYLGCEKPSRCLSLCVGHYGQTRRGVELKPLINWADLDCRGPRCGNKAAHRTGYCRPHHGQKTKHGYVWVLGDRSAAPDRKPRTRKVITTTQCLFTGCDVPRVGGVAGFCTTHRQLSGHLKTRYGINIETRCRMLEAQRGLCLICDIDITSQPHVDHCHTTGKVRGLLCGPCNRALGMMQDDPVRLIRAAEYLKAGD